MPIWDPAFYARLRTSLKKGGVLVFEHFLHDGPDAPARFAGTPEPNELLRVFAADFRVLKYEDAPAVSDWFPRKATLTAFERPFVGNGASQIWQSAERGNRLTGNCPDPASVKAARPQLTAHQTAWAR